MIIKNKYNNIFNRGLQITYNLFIIIIIDDFEAAESFSIFLFANEESEKATESYKSFLFLFLSW